MLAEGFYTSPTCSCLLWSREQFVIEIGSLLLCLGIVCVKLHILPCNELSNSGIGRRGESNNSCFPTASSNFADINILLHFPNPCVRIMFISTSIYMISTLDFLGMGMGKWSHKCHFLNQYRLLVVVIYINNSICFLMCNIYKNKLFHMK